MTHWILPRQKTIYSCGAACIRAVSHILDGPSWSESEILLKLHADPVCGIDNERLAAFCLEHLPVMRVGEDIWDGDHLAVINIRNPLSDVGHFVVALRRIGGGVVAYCPYFARTIFLPDWWLQHKWMSGCERYHRWGIVFHAIWSLEDTVVGEGWPELGLAEGEVNPFFLQRSAYTFLNRWSF